MFWDALYNAGAILTSSLAGGAIVFALSSWLGKVWASRILEQDRAKYQREASQSLQLLRDRIERGQFVHSLQFEAEFGVYRRLWEKVVKVRNAALSLRPTVDYVSKDPALRGEDRKNRRKAAGDSFNAFLECYTSEEPFFAPQVYETADKLAKVVREEVHEFDDATRDNRAPDRKYWDTADENAKAIIEYAATICRDIRERIGILSGVAEDRDKQT